MIVSRVIGCGAYLPKNIVKNDELPAELETSDEWISERTGIRQRHLAADGEYTSDLGAAAAKQALERANLSADDVDMILLATATPDRTFPGAGVEIQRKINANNAVAMDVQAACSGFVYVLHLADALIKSGSAKTILVIGAETMSRVVDWKDRRTCILFGDGAGAMVLQATEDTSDTPRGILYSEIHSDGNYADILATDGGISSTQAAGFLAMEGQEVFRHAVSKMSGVAKSSLEALSFSTDDVNWVIPHQANHRILTACGKKLRLPDEKMVSTVASHANTSSASIPLAINEIVTEGKVKDGDILLLPALGAGLTWGSCIIRW